ncbi:hypothetical protein [Diaminobutyricimonas sp. TR449]|uniref:hypothetical protein n=1 Tax=Diaminobutyricimonas sp. TR449 TaxID=2708076 RepID=UPI001423565C|nr:hypothetical protein [Diaminobutyricimonas sp. TR449]
MSSPRHGAALIAVLLAASISLTACAPVQPEQRRADATAQLAERVSDTVSAEGVLLAAVLLSTADIESAVAEGLVTPDEVDEARRAIEDDSLDAWRALAERTAGD